MRDKSTRISTAKRKVKGRTYVDKTSIADYVNWDKLKREFISFRQVYICAEKPFTLVFGFDDPEEATLFKLKYC